MEKKIRTFGDLRVGDKVLVCFLLDRLEFWEVTKVTPTRGKFKVNITFMNGNFMSFVTNGTCASCGKISDRNYYRFWPDPGKGIDALIKESEDSEFGLKILGAIQDGEEKGLF